jgi:nitrogen fixation/metabolism regulation signal transduction histidine kinase
MAIVKAIADTHGATLELDAGPGGTGLAVSVRFRSASSEKTQEIN